ncbi:enoyl-CoA hydratase [Bradyrhizobium sp. GCM10027634]|uniref:enoyl-CoA hydratase n=1 Tax=unclassified Bradyrhizobium TaxID=2631580 RepID=UPI00263A6A18|nr:enoyl-CoA hydratase [Bradyrhizobium sp. WYCCWR 12677]MDN5005476.1 enoyl-CoA hydratase [Bradyrhizobium sp. WYCCWR 12677]
MSEHIKLKEEDGVLEITFARPDKKNALSNAMYRTAREALESAQTNKAVRVVLFSAEGDAFTAGNDIGDFANIANGQAGERQAHLFIEALGRAEKPIVAAVPGLAVGVGTTMLLHCDLVYITETAKLSAPFVNLGLVPEAASSMLLPARIGYVRAFAVFALGEGISGAEAVALGLANKMLPQGDVLEAARGAAKVLARKPPGSLISTKKLMRNAATLLERMDVESAVFGERLKSDEAREAFRAFAERRPPDFSKFTS